MSNCPKCGVRILGDSTECPVCDRKDVSGTVNPSSGHSSGGGGSAASKARKCSKCGIRLLGKTTVCPNCGDKKGLTKSDSSGMGCGILVMVAIVVGLGYGLKSCVGMFSEESRDQVRKDRYHNCVQVAENRAAAACSVDACNVGCQIENMDNPLAITRCINRCRESSPEEQQKICEDAQSTVLWTAIRECPR